MSRILSISRNRGIKGLLTTVTTTTTSSSKSKQFVPVKSISIGLPSFNRAVVFSSSRACSTAQIGQGYRRSNSNTSAYGCDARWVSNAASSSQSMSVDGVDAADAVAPHVDVQDEQSTKITVETAEGAAEIPTPLVHAELNETNETNETNKTEAKKGKEREPRWTTPYTTAKELEDAMANSTKLGDYAKTIEDFMIAQNDKSRKFDISRLAITMVLDAGMNSALSEDVFAFLYNGLVKHGMNVSTNQCNVMIEMCTKMAKHHDAEILFAHMQRTGHAIAPNLDTYNLILNLRAYMRDPLYPVDKHVRFMREKLCTIASSVVNVTVASLVRSNHPSMALRLVNDAFMQGYLARYSTIAAILMQSTLIGDMKTVHDWIDMTESKRLRSARVGMSASMFDEAIVNVMRFDALDAAEKLQFLRKEMHPEIPLGTEAMISMLNATRKDGKIIEGLDLARKLEELGIKVRVRDVPRFVDSLGRNISNIDVARLFLSDRMSSGQRTSLLEANILIAACSQSLEMDRALALFEDLKMLFLLTANSDSFNSLLHCCAVTGRYDLVNGILSRMLEDGVEADRETNKLLIWILCRKSNPIEACKILKACVDKGQVPTPDTFMKLWYKGRNVIERYFYDDFVDVCLASNIKALSMWTEPLNVDGRKSDLAATGKYTESNSQRKERKMRNRATKSEVSKQVNDPVEHAGQQS